MQQFMLFIFYELDLFLVDLLKVTMHFSKDLLY